MARKVRLTTDAEIEGRPYKCGDEPEVSDYIATQLFKLNAAVEITGNPPQQKEQAKK